MPIFQAVRRYKKWPVRVPLWDARECPDCAALVCGDAGQDAHRDYHEAMRAWQDQMQEWGEGIHEAIRQTAAGAGLTVVETEPETGLAGGEYSALDVNPDELHDAKRRRVPWRQLVTSTIGDDDGDESMDG